MSSRGSRSHAGGGGNAPASQGSAIKSLENYDQHYEQRAQRLLAGLSDADKDYIRSQIKALIDRSDFYMNISEGNLYRVMTSHFKNQFETGGQSGGASFDASDLTLNNERVRTAVNMFNMDYTTMQASDYEKYGSLQPSDLLSAVDASPLYYGSVLVKFRKSAVIDRATITLDDSLAEGMSGGLIPGKVSDYRVPLHNSVMYNSWLIDGLQIAEQEVNAGRITKPTQWVCTAFRRGTGYVEVQYHGHLSMGDVESVVFTKNQPSANDVKELKNMHVNVYFKEWNGLRHEYVLKQL